MKPVQRTVPNCKILDLCWSDLTELQTSKFQVWKLAKPRQYRAYRAIWVFELPRARFRWTQEKSTHPSSFHGTASTKFSPTISHFRGNIVCSFFQLLLLLACRWQVIAFVSTVLLLTIVAVDLCGKVYLFRVGWSIDIYTRLLYFFNPKERGERE